MKITNILLLFLFVFTLSVSCKKTGLETADDSGMIYFQVTPEASVSKSMIENDTDLQRSCTPTTDDPTGGDQSIGLWAAMFKDGQTTNDVFQGVNLQWHAVGEKGHEYNPSTSETGSPSYWNTFITEGGVVKHAEVYWHPGETYYFRAYYPAGVELASNTSAATFIAEYNARAQQDDMMAGYAKVSLNSKEDLQKHVPLHMLHMLAAVKLNFKFKDESGFEKSDVLKSVWLENTSTGQFGDYALLVFGDGTEAGATAIDWYIMDTPSPGVKMYEWTNSTGVEFHRNSSENISATAYTATGMDPSQDKGAIFTESNGFVYMIPQDLHPGTKICFTTENSGGNVFEVAMPSVLYDNATPTPNEYTSLQPGYRYTLDIIISKLDINVFITIKEWNKLDSSYSIDF